VTGSLYLWYTTSITGVAYAPIGVYDHPSPIPGVDSVAIGDSAVSKFFRDLTSVAKTITSFGAGVWDPIQFL
jgi:hypothetical protein